MWARGKGSAANRILIGPKTTLIEGRGIKGKKTLGNSQENGTASCFVTNAKLMESLPSQSGKKGEIRFEIEDTELRKYISS